MNTAATIDQIVQLSEPRRPEKYRGYLRTLPAAAIEEKLLDLVATHGRRLPVVRRKREAFASRRRWELGELKPVL